MKKVIAILLVAATSCSGPKASSENTEDSLSTHPDSTSSIKITQTTSRYATPQQKVLGVPVSQLLEGLRFPVQSCMDEMPPDSVTHSFSSTEVIEGNYSDVTGGCTSAGAKIFSLQFQPGEIVLDGGQEVDIGDVVYYNEYNFYSVDQLEDSVFITNKLNGGWSCAHPGFAATITTDYNLTIDCPTMVVEYSTAGGDNTPWKNVVVEFFLLENGEFKSVLSTELENSFTMMNFGGGPNNYIEQFYSIQVLQSTTMGLKDIQLTNKQTGSYETLRFNGERYTNK